MGERRPTVVLRDNRDDQTYEAEVDGEVIGIIGYRDAGEGGAGQHLGRPRTPPSRHCSSADQIRSRRHPSASAHVDDHVPDRRQLHPGAPEYADIVDASHPGRAPRPEDRCSEGLQRMIKPAAQRGCSNQAGLCHPGPRRRIPRPHRSALATRDHQVPRPHRPGVQGRRPDQRAAHWFDHRSDRYNQFAARYVGELSSN